MNEQGLQDIIDRINDMAIQGPWANNINEMDVWLNGYKEAVTNIITLIRGMMDRR